ncbi:type II toxin-antitoxin system RelE/ParE family toxin [Rhizobium leguminosarum]|uniref:type II toxin-antitoxin system RelE/ParE family toxin n=1 Tax=Rhizobium leguminosarum TaxID=384 RepID=UPI001C964D72|nr:type II toxin-antitoxin system RelE/ParE family toxin [Rhizobium leguminosarum]MBY5334785.1 type II toxin-antitoxin system RelE/ParE family toxin [Rhizobium leguminosarum]
MSFKLSAEAEEDIIAIAEQGVRMFGAGQAKRYHDELFALFDPIAVNPGIARERDEIDPPVRIYPKAHLIVYGIEDDDTIFVIRIRHAHDWASDSI